jgi:prepilin-type N-terminal cleavage/methylation domain-containing protein
MKRCNEHGFTLIEVLVALVLFGLAATMVANLSVPQTQRAKLIAFKAALEARFADARTTAKLKGVRVSLRFDPTLNRIEGEGVRALVIPRDLTIDLISAWEVNEQGRPAVLFFPDGTNTGLRYEIGVGDLKESGALSWLGRHPSGAQ